ncbi:alpha-L-rhamnosidase [Prolixibacteraceae bacterium JC049]|nr:alpha-L-rhamnosidase [Prolixibacteraceae bacterium JC049]
MIYSKHYLCSIVLLYLLTLNTFGQTPKIDLTPHFQIINNKPKSIIEIKKGHYFIDFGKTYFGTVILKSQQTLHDTLVVHLGEKLSNINSIDRKPPGSVRYQRNQLSHLSRDKETTIQLKPNKRNSNPPAILLPDTFGVIMPFRYCELENLTIPIDQLEITQKAFHYQFNDSASAFSSSDSILNQIWELCKHSIKATSFTGYYIDGDRERIPYEADAYINQLSHYSVDNNYSLARRTNEYFIDHPTWPTEWLLHTTMLFYQDFMYTGDTTMISKYYEQLKLKTLVDLSRKDGLISSKSNKIDKVFKAKLGFKNPNAKINDIVDWPPEGWSSRAPKGERDGYEMKEINTVVNCFFYHNLCLIAKIADYLGKTEEAILFRQKSQQVKNTINQKLFDKTRSIYIDGEGSKHASLHANMFPLAFDIVPKENIKTVYEHIKKRGMACSVYGAQYLLEGLYKAGKAEYAFQLMTDTTHDRTWWNMLQKGSTITFEAWDQTYKPNQDWNHAWGTAPLNVVTRYMWGITPKKPGFESALIKPQLSPLTQSSIKVPTIVGEITASFKKEGTKELYEIQLPTNMTGTFILPAKWKKAYLNNQPVNKELKKISLKNSQNSITIIK